jgi:hypothetical protein
LGQKILGLRIGVTGPHEGTEDDLFQEGGVQFRLLGCRGSPGES